MSCYLFYFFTAIAEALNCKICVKSDKKMVLNCLDDATLSTRVSTKWQDSGLHVLPMMKLNYKVSNSGWCYLKYKSEHEMADLRATCASYDEA